MINFLNRIITKTILFLALIGFIPLNSINYDCSFVSWAPDYEHIFEVVSKKHDTIHPFLLQYNESWFGPSGYRRFIYDCIDGHQAKQEAFKKRFLRDESNNIDEVLSDLYPDGLIKMAESSDPAQGKKLKEAKKKAAKKFVELANNRITSRKNAYTICAINEFARNNDLEEIECPNCLALNKKAETSTTTTEQPKKAEKSRLKKLCKKHSKAAHINGGIFASVNYNDQKDKENLPSFGQNPALWSWRQIQDREKIVHLGDAVFSDLRMFVGDRENNQTFNNLLERLNYTYSDWGYAFFDYMFARPSKDLQTLIRRREFIKKLVQDDALYNDLVGILKEMAKCQEKVNDFIFAQHSFFSQNGGTWLYPDGLSHLKILHLLAPYSTSVKKLTEKINRNQTLIAIGYPVQIASDLAGIAWPIGMILFGKTGLISLGKNEFIGGMIKGESFPFGRHIITPLEDYRGPFAQQKGFINFFDSLRLTGKKFLEAEADSVGKAFQLKNNGSWNTGSIIRTILLGLSSIEGAFIAHRYGRLLAGPVKLAQEGTDCLNKVNSFYSVKMKNTPKTCAEIKKMTLALARFANLSKKLSKLLQAHLPDEHPLTLVDDLHEFVCGNNPELTKTLREIASCNSKSMDCKILSVLRKAHPFRWLFARPAEAIGQIDAFVSAARLIRETALLGTENNYCPVEFVQSACPGFKLDGFWNPFLKPEVAVANTMHIGLDLKEQHMILTGLNGGGKSTALRNMVFDEIMAHVFGFTPAVNAVTCIYDNIHTCMATKDCAEGKSTYMVQNDKVMENLAIIEMSGKTNERSLLALDEIYGGTDNVNAVPNGITFGLFCCKNQSSTVLFSSHFYQMCTLQERTGGIFKNMKIRAEKDEKGNFKRIFKIEPGRIEPGHDAIGLQLTKDSGAPKEFVEQAERIKGELFPVR